jgi:hypothetical protein
VSNWIELKDRHHEDPRRDPNDIVSRLFPDCSVLSCSALSNSFLSPILLFPFSIRSRSHGLIKMMSHAPQAWRSTTRPDLATGTTAFASHVALSTTSNSLSPPTKPRYEKHEARLPRFHAAEQGGGDWKTLGSWSLSLRSCPHERIPTLSLQRPQRPKSKSHACSYPSLSSITGPTSGPGYLWAIPDSLLWSLTRSRP